MEIYANLRTKVEVNPIDVIEELKEDFLGNSRRWVSKKDDKWFIMEDKSAGTHSYEDEVREISKKELKYYEALKDVEVYLNKHYNKH